MIELADVPLELRARGARQVIARDRGLSVDERLVILHAAIWPDGGEHVPELQDPELDAPWGRCESPICGKPLPEPPRRTPQRRRYCDHTCADQGRLEARRLRPRPCEECGELFQPAQRDARFCGTRCYQRSWRRARARAAV